MWNHCIVCSSDLGANQDLEEFQIGGRLAFDSQKGRLWVVCPRCERWNLVPLEQRWEAVEALERAYRDTPARYSTSEIGLAQLRGGLQIVRIGDPIPGEDAIRLARRALPLVNRRTPQFVTISDDLLPPKGWEAFREHARAAKDSVPPTVER